ncbi:MAG: hypothetical protein GXP31_14195 [Kiritimatiellaeota bacterium]|nr:hypothetical protein [Kiritimatiellota bacterium]
MRRVPGSFLSPTRLACPAILAGVAVCLLPTNTVAGPLTLHVSGSGSDGADGRTPESAVRSLGRARDLLRELRKQRRLSEGALVLVGPGVYELPDGLGFGPEDAASDAAPVVFKAEKKGAAILRGGRTLRGWERTAEGRWFHAWRKQDGELRRFDSVYYRGRRIVPARVPNRDPRDLHGGRWAHVVRSFGREPRRRFVVGRDLGVPLSKALIGARVGVFCKRDWRWNRIPIADVDPERRVVTLARNATYALSPGDRYFIEGGTAADAAGEWSFTPDPRAAGAGRISVLLPEKASATPAQMEINFPSASSILVFENTRGLRFHGFVLEVSRGDAVRIGDSRNIRIEACIIRNTDGWGVRIERGGECIVDGCDIYDTGRGGVLVSGGDRKSLLPAGHEVRNCVIHHIGNVEKTYNTGINIRGVGNAARHNLVYHTPHAGMTLGGNDNTIEFNRIHHTNLESADTGGIYSCPRDWTQRGNVIRWNVWHDIGGYGKKNSWRPVVAGKVVFEYPHFTWGIYMDDPTSGNLIYGNILYRVPVCALHNHGGRDNRFENNIVIDCPALQMGMLSPTWSEWPAIRKRFDQMAGRPDSLYLQRYPGLKQGYPGSRPEAMTGLRFERNIVYFTKAGTAWLRKWRDWNDAIRLYIVRARPEDMAANVLDRNLIFAEPGLKLEIAYTAVPAGERRLSWKQWRGQGFDANSILADPMFVDPQHPERAKFAMRPGSPARRIGFKPIPVDKIGVFPGPNRATWPVKLARVDREAPPPVREEFELYPPRPARPFAVRGGLPNLAARLRRPGETVRVAYFGGGIHPASGWRAQVLGWLRSRYPGTKFEAIDAGICDCVRGSAFSVYRFRHDVLAKSPDLILVDFTSGDKAADNATLERVVEGLVRQARRDAPRADLLFLYVFRAEFEPAYGRGMLPSPAMAWDRVAEVYGVPSVDLGLAVQAEIRKGRMTVRPPVRGGRALFSKDGVRPSAAADKVYATALTKALAAILAGSKAPSVVRTPLREPIDAANFENARLVPIRRSMLVGPWRELPPDHPLRQRFAAHFETIWETTTPGARLRFRFRGTQAGLFALLGPDSGRVQVTVDGVVSGTRGSADRWSYFQRFCALPCAAGLPDGEHEIEVELLPGPPDRSEAVEEARKLKRYEPGMFEGVALRVGWIRLVGDWAK